MWRDDAHLLDMLLAARKALEFTSGVSLDGFQNNETLQFATLRALQIIGEAARRVSSEYKDAHPEIPWPAIVGMGLRLVHEYFQIRVATVWGLVKNDLPELIRQLEALVPPEDTSG